MYHRIVFVFLCIFQFSYFINAQTENAPSPALESPYNTIYVHLYYLQSDSYRPEIAARTLYGISDSLKRIDLAVKLKRVMDGRGLYVHLNLLPQENDYIDTLTEKPYYTPFPDKLPQVYLEKIEDQWYYSSETVNLIPKLYKDLYPFGTAWLIDLIPDKNQTRMLGLATWQYIGLLLLILFSWILHLIFSKLLFFLVRGLAHSRFKDHIEDIKPITKIARAISLLLLAIVVKIFLPVLQLPINASTFLMLALNIAITVFVVVLVLRIVDLVMVYATAYAYTTEKKMDEQLLPIIKRTLYILFVIGGIIQILRLLDVNVTALLAGISIGGLALALAAQDTVKNLIGSIMIFIDKPFQIGDFIEGSGFVGVVMEVGFRTTRIKTADTSILSVPNGSIANMVITNMGVRVFRLFNTEIGLTYDTPPELIQLYVEGLRKMVLNHPSTRKEDYYIYLSSLQSSSVNILFRVFLQVADWNEELKVKGEFTHGFLNLAQEIGVSFAFPSTTLYIEEFPGKLSNRPSKNEPVAALKEKVDAFIQDFSAKHSNNDSLN